MAVSLSLANRHASLPVAWRLYLPQEWAADPTRRRKAHVPADITFKTKAEIALDQLRWACAAGLPRGVVLLDAGLWQQQRLARRDHGTRLDLCGRDLSTTTVWPPGTAPLGRPPTRLRRDRKHQPIAVKELALAVGLSEGYRPRSSPAAARAPHPELDHDDAPPLDCRSGQNAPAMSMLFSADDKASAAEKFLMQ